jgi:hypothetical protein
VTRDDVALAPDDIQDHRETEDLLDHAEENITGLILATAAYCKARNLSFADWVAFVGNHFAPTWEELKGQGAIDVAHRVAFNLLTAGAAVEALSGDDKRAEVRCTWPFEEDLDFLDVSRDDLDPFFDVFGPIANHLGCRYDHQRVGEHVTMVFAR